MIKALFILLLSFTFLAGCNTYKPTKDASSAGPCDNMGDEAKINCLQSTNAKLQTLVEAQFTSEQSTETPAAAANEAAPVKEATVAPPQPAQTATAPTGDVLGVGPGPQRQVVGMDLAPNGDAGCLPKHNLSVPNRSTFYLEVRGNDLRPCGASGIFPINVLQKNGGIRTAYVVPPGATGTFTFYPYRQYNGYPISTNGRKNYEIDVYEASGVMGLQPAMPAAHVVTIRQFVDIPTIGTWRRNVIDDTNIRTALAMR